MRTEKTIRRCSKIIKLLKISLKAKRKDCYKRCIFSVALYDENYPYAFSSVCGNSYKEALACALGEFIERLQHGLLYNEFYFCTGLPTFEKVLSIDSLNIKKEFLPYKNEKKIDCYEYKNVYSNNKEYIPVTYIK